VVLDSQLTNSEHGAPNISTYLRIFKVGDIVDIVANSSEQKGMPHKCEYQTPYCTHFHV